MTYPQSNGKLERWHKSLKSECIRPGTPLTREDALRLIHTYVHHYNTIRLHSAIGYVTPHDMLAGRQAEIHAARDRKLEEARHQRQLRRTAQSLHARSSKVTTITLTGETEAGSAGMQSC
jgi:putative transposase